MNNLLVYDRRDPDDTLQYLWCVDAEWKLLLRYDGKDTTRYRNVHVWDTAPVRLYDLRNDPEERHELSLSHPRVVADLRAKIESWHPVSRRQPLRAARLREAKR